MSYLVIIQSGFLCQNTVTAQRWIDAMNILASLSWTAGLQCFESSGSLLWITKQQQIASGWKAERVLNKGSAGGTVLLLINEFGPTLCLPHPVRLHVRPPVYALFFFFSLTPTDWLNLTKVSQLVKVLNWVTLCPCVVEMSHNMIPPCTVYMTYIKWALLEVHLLFNNTSWVKELKCGWSFYQYLLMFTGHLLAIDLFIIQYLKVFTPLISKLRC